VTPLPSEPASYSIRIGPHHSIILPDVDGKGAAAWSSFQRRDVVATRSLAQLGHAHENMSAPAATASLCASRQLEGILGVK